MAAGPLVVTYQLTERSKAILAEELGGVAEAIYLPELPEERRAEALAHAGAVLANDTSTELRPGEAPLLRNARLLQFTAAGIDWVPTRDLPRNCRSPATRAPRPSRWPSMSSRWCSPRPSVCSSSMKI
jgi:hypothetical protein